MRRVPRLPSPGPDRGNPPARRAGGSLRTTVIGTAVLSTILAGVQVSGLPAAAAHAESGQGSLAAAAPARTEPTPTAMPAPTVTPAETPTPTPTETPTESPRPGTGEDGKDEPEAGDPIPGSYIVLFADKTGIKGEKAIKKAAEDLTGRVGGTVKDVYSTVLRGFSAKLTAAQAREMKRQPEVASVTQDVVVEAATASRAGSGSVSGTASTTRSTTASSAGTGSAAARADDDPSVQLSPPWHLDRLDQLTPQLSGTFDAPDASGAHIYILDTGVRATHEEFGGRVKDGMPEGDHDDCSGHGTAVAGAAAGRTHGVAKDATIHRIRVLNCDGYGPATQALDAIDWLTRNGPRPAVVNISWRTGGDLDSPLAVAIRNSIRAGVTYVVVAPNDRLDACAAVPSLIPEVITVGAVDRTDARTSQGYGSCVDLYAPGSDILTAKRDSDTATDSVGGTSLAAPLTAGAAAAYLAAHPDATPRQVTDALLACAQTGLVVDPAPQTPNRLLSTDCGAGGLRLTNPGRQITARGHEVRISKVRVTGNTAGNVRYSATGLPEGVSIDPATGVISGRPAKAVSTVVTVRAATGAGELSTRFAWDVIYGYGTFALADNSALCLDNDNSIRREGNKIWLHQACGQTWRMGGDGRIVFIDRDDDWCLAISEQESPDGRLIALSRCSDAATQVWEHRDDGTLRNPATGGCLTAPRVANAVQLTLADCTGGTGQRWYLPALPKGDPLRIERREEVVTSTAGPVSRRLPATSLDTARTVRYSAAGLPVGVSIDPDTGIMSGTVLPQPSTTVTVTVRYADGPSDGPSASASFRWQVANGTITGVNGHCVDVMNSRTADNTPVLLFSCNSTHAQLWSVYPDGRLEGRGGCLMPQEGATGPNPPIVIFSCTGAPAQVWRAGTDGTLRHPATGRCLTGPRSGQWGSQLVLADCTGAAPQIWTLPTNPAAGLFTTPSRQDLRIGANVNLTIDGRATSYRVTGLPEGLSFDAATGRITGTPVKAGAGGALITATGPNGVTGRGAFTWSVHHGRIPSLVGRCAGNQGRDPRDGTPVILDSCDNNVERQWTIQPDGTLEVMGKCATVKDNAVAAGSPIVIEECDARPAQIWQPRDDDTLRNPASGRCLSAPVAEGSNQLVLADCTGSTAQRWLLPTRTTTGPISHATRNRCVEPDRDYELKDWDCNGTAPQQWTATARGLLVDRDIRCLTVAGGGRSPGTAVVRAACDEADATQIWRRQPDGTVLHPASNLCLNITLSGPRRFTVETCTGSEEQRWNIPVHPGAA